MRKEISTERHQEESRASDHPLHVSDSDTGYHRDGGEPPTLPRTTIPESRGTSLFRATQVWGHLAGVPRRCARVGRPRGSAPVFPIRRPVSRRRARRLRVGASRRRRRRHGAEPGAGSLLRLGQHAHRHGRGESEGHVGGNVPATASSGEPGAPPRALSRPLGPSAHCPVGSLRAGAPGPEGPS